MIDHIELTLEKELGAFNRILPTLDQFIQRHDLQDRLAYALRLVLEELFLNLIKYSKAGQRSNQAWVSIALRSEDTLITIEDDGPPFDPTMEAIDPVKPRNLAEARPGGVGLALVRHMTAGLHYERRGERNHLEARLMRDGA